MRVVMISTRHGSGLGITLVANWRCFRRKFQYRFRHQLRHEPQFRSLFDSGAKYGIGFDVDSSFGFECGVGLCINLEISLIPNFDIGLSVGFDSETRFDGKFCLIFSTLFLSLRDCTNGDIWVSLNLRKKSEEEFLCVMPMAVPTVSGNAIRGPRCRGFCAVCQESSKGGLIPELK